MNKTRFGVNVLNASDYFETVCSYDNFEGALRDSLRLAKIGYYTEVVVWATNTTTGDVALPTTVIGEFRMDVLPVIWWGNLKDWERLASAPLATAADFNHLSHNGMVLEFGSLVAA